MLTELALTHPCDTIIHLVAGAWTTPRGRVITHCPGCGEWLGSAFLMLGSVDYVKGNGPFSGFITFSSADGSTIGVSMQGETVASADGANASFNATLGLIGGTGRYTTAKGTGTFVGSRNATLGTTVAPTFDLHVERRDLSRR